MVEKKKTYYLAWQGPNGRWKVVERFLTPGQWASNKAFHKNLINQTKKVSTVIVNRKNKAIDAEKKKKGE